MAIARAAYDMINDGDSVYLDSGTTTFELAKLLCNGPKRGILVATNALDHAGVLLGQQGISLILIGGFATMYAPVQAIWPRICSATWSLTRDFWALSTFPSPTALQRRI